MITGGCLAAGAALTMALLLAVNPVRGEVRGLFDRAGDGALHWSNDVWSATSAPGRGWTSLRVGGDEFLHGLVARHQGQWIVDFPDSSNISHAQELAHRGSVSDGIWMIELRPDWRDDGAFEIYAGHNTDGDASLVLLFSEDVAMLRRGAGAGPRHGRPLIGASLDQPVETDGLTAVHRSGRSIGIEGKCRAGLITGPDGARRLAAIFSTTGFAANSIRARADATARAGNFISRPLFDVRSSDDPQKNTLGATAGVKNPIYGQQTKLDFAVRFDWHRSEPFTGYAEVEVVHALGQEHFRQRVELRDIRPEKTEIRAIFAPQFHLPGVSEVWGRIVDGDGRLVWVDRYRMLYDYERFQPRLLVQDDHQQFWEQTLARLRATPLAPTTERVERLADHPRFDFYEVSFNGWDGKRVYAMLSVPKGADKPLPAIVTAHPAARGFNVNKGPDGLYGSKSGGDERFVTIQPLIRGHKPDAPDVPFNHPWWGPLDDRDTYVARAWYCAMVRAVDYLATRPDLVDMNRVVAMGGSQGGALALVTAALDHRIAYCFADCPSNCQPHELLRGLYPSFGPSAGQVPAGQSVDDVERMLSYYNPVNFAPMIRCPTYVGSNVGDLTVHSMGPLAAYANLTGLSHDQKAFYPGFTHFHGSGPGLTLKRREILSQLTAGGSEAAE
jgi:cephalosporin-C deacetylase-like acetyl esterase